MFETKRRLIATICIVGFLVVSFGMFTPPAYSNDCSTAINNCCAALFLAAYYCNLYGSGSGVCDAWQRYAGEKCSTAAEICGYSVYHLCYN